MRIGVIAHLKHPIAEPFAGGLESHTHLLARRLRDRGHDVVLYASTRSDPALGLEAICDETALADVGLAEAGDVAFFTEHHAYLDLMRRLSGGGFDVVHNNALHYLPVAMAGALPCPMVTTLHTPPFCWLESGVRANVGLRSRFVAVSQAVARAWSPITPVDRVILNGIDLARFPFSPEPDPAPYLIWYGRIVPEKGLHHAIDAAARLGLPLRIAGPVSDDAYFSTLIAPRLGGPVQWLGHLDQTALAREIAGARAFLCTPCWEEPYGLVVAEALACGTPVAAFDRGAMSEILDDRCGRLAAPDDVDALARAARQVLDLSRQACRRRALEHCGVDAAIDAYEACYGAEVARWPDRRAAAERAPAVRAAAPGLRSAERPSERAVA
ncbi:MAG: glycosyltransferase family 4 protein [Brevundimonas sp.]|uniref:glycosyltransferase family 4 protein n=1 Tax=Brevundimonas sp. TaxID=1871086 RepID=UPI003919111C